MSILNWKRGIVSLGLIATVAAQMTAASQALAGDSSLPADAPAWSRKDVARVWYNPHGDLRKGSDYQTFRINEDGIISGEELLSLARPRDAMAELMAQFAAYQAAQGKVSGVMVPPRAPVTQVAMDQALAKLVLARVLDHEAMKRKMPADVSDARVDFVLRSLLTENAAERHLLATHEESCSLAIDANASGFSNPVMYDWLRQSIGGNMVKFNIDWQFDKGGVSFERDLLIHSRNELNWPAVTLEFNGALPSTVDEFRDQIREKLRPTLISLRRRAVFERLFAERNPLINFKALGSNTEGQFELYYKQLGDQAFKVVHGQSDVTEIRIEGAKAAEFQARFITLLHEREKQYAPEFKQEPPSPPSPMTPANPVEDERLWRRSVELRSTIPAQIFAQLMAEFGKDVSVSRTEQTLSFNSNEAPPSGNSYAAEKFAAAFSQKFYGSALFPSMTGSDCKTLYIMMPRELRGLPSTVVARDSDEARQYLRGVIASKIRGNAYRNLVLQLLSESRVESLASTCTEQGWPCTRGGPRRLTEALLPETLFPGKTADGYSSTLGHDELLDRVMSINADALNSVFALPNVHQDEPTFWPHA
jgi:hypothetical protein